MSDWSTLTLTCARGQYSASTLARAIEDCDAHVLNLNVTGMTHGDTDNPVIEVRISHTNPMPVVRSVARYGYEVLATKSSSASENDDVAIDRLHHLMRWLEV